MALQRCLFSCAYKCWIGKSRLPSCGSVGFKGSRRSTNYAAQATAENAARAAIQLGFKFVEVRIKGLGYGKESLHIQLGFKFVEVRIKGLGYGKESSLRGLKLSLIITNIRDIHQSQHSFQKSGKELCKCRFKLAWEAGPCKHQEVYLGCADISFIEPESVERHPVAREVLQGARDYQESKDVVTDDEPGQILPTEDVKVNSVDAVTDEPDLILPTEDVEVNCVDAVSDDPPSEKRREGLFTSKDTEGLPQDFIRKVQNYNHFYEFLGEQADILKEALDKYNARNNISFT